MQESTRGSFNSRDMDEPGQIWASWKNDRGCNTTGLTWSTLDNWEKGLPESQKKSGDHQRVGLGRWWSVKNGWVTEEMVEVYGWPWMMRRCGNNDISEHHDRNDLGEVERWRRGGKRKKGAGSRVLNNSKWNRGGLICWGSASAAVGSNMSELTFKQLKKYNINQRSDVLTLER